MSSWIVRFGVLMALPVAVLAFADASAAKTKQPVDVKEACQKDVMKQIKTKHPGAKDIQLTVSRDWQQSSTESGIGGTGTLKATNGSGRDFDWTCVYDVKKNKVLKVEVDKTGEISKKDMQKKTTK
jgi:hypothetical protein